MKGKGTKQIRMGRVEKAAKEIEYFINYTNHFKKSFDVVPEKIVGILEGLDLALNVLRQEFPELMAGEEIEKCPK